MLIALGSFESLVDMWDPLGVFLLGHCVRLGIVCDFSNHVLISFYSFYHSLELSFLYRFDLKFRNLIFNLEGQNSLFTQNLDTIFNVTKTHQKCTFWKLDISPMILSSSSISFGVSIAMF